jgi:hypothetical protein
MIKSLRGSAHVNGLKTSRVGLALALCLLMAGASSAGAATTAAKPHHRAATHHAATSHVATSHAVKSHAVRGHVTRGHAAKGHAAKSHTRRRAKTAVAQAEPTRRHAELCRTVMVRHHEVEKCR